ncbi:hypothetical protein KCM76_24510 [Zooshikella marina]|uniref:hypothetical protein n=1 Tax=Zooshikella ganghwensis TaxID=202772 RepID=UPI001BAE9148|nr:hypothetical protein [Zooshikella ganghwensis]MBU2709181.1 hypothetical protein [Zooshikella ganghwensis]
MKKDNPQQTDLAFVTLEAYVKTSQPETYRQLIEQLNTLETCTQELKRHIEKISLSAGLVSTSIH